MTHKKRGETVGSHSAVRSVQAHTFIQWQQGGRQTDETSQLTDNIDWRINGAPLVHRETPALCSMVDHQKKLQRNSQITSGQMAVRKKHCSICKSEAVARS